MNPLENLDSLNSAGANRSPQPNRLEYPGKLTSTHATIHKRKTFTTRNVNHGRSRRLMRSRRWQEASYGCHVNAGHPHGVASLIFAEAFRHFDTPQGPSRRSYGIKWVWLTAVYKSNVD